MKIVHITWMFTFGGIETMLVNLGNEQAKLGHEVHIVVMEEGVTDESLKGALSSAITIHNCHRAPGGNLVLPAIRLNAILLKLNPNVIHVHSSGLYRLIVPRCFKRITNTTLHALPKAKNTMAIKTVPRVFAISEAVRQELLAFNGTDSITIPNGIKTKLIASRQKNDWTDTLKIVQVGRLDHGDKGQHILLQAGAELLKRGKRNFVIHLIGDGASKSFLEEMMQHLSLQNLVVFHGMQPQSYIFEHLCEYDLFVQPSIREGFGNTVAEAMVAKLPVIVSSGQGPEEVIGYGKYGYVFENGNPSSLADKLEIFLNKENNVEQIEQAYAHAVDSYDISATAQAYLNNYLRR